MSELIVDSPVSVAARPRRRRGDFLAGMLIAMSTIATIILQSVAAFLSAVLATYMYLTLYLVAGGFPMAAIISTDAYRAYSAMTAGTAAGFAVAWVMVWTVFRAFNISDFSDVADLAKAHLAKSKQ